MNLKSLLVAAVLMSPVTSFALGLVTPADRVIIKTEQFKGVSYLLEKGLGRPLTVKEKTDLARSIPNGPIDTDEDKLIIKVADGPQEKTYALYCIGLTGSVIARGALAECASLQTMNSYTLFTIGAGVTGELSANVFRLSLVFDSSEHSGYSSTLTDPFPGTYVVVSGGATVGGGATIYAGTAIEFIGGRRLYGLGINAGLGVDAGTPSVLALVPQF